MGGPSPVLTPMSMISAAKDDVNISLMLIIRMVLTFGIHNGIGTGTGTVTACSGIKVY